MKVVTRAFGFGLWVSLYLAIAATLLASRPGYAQKVLRIEQTPDGIAVKNVADDEAVNVTRGKVFHRTTLKVTRLESVRFSYLAPPDNTLIPPYNWFQQPLAKGPDLMSRIKGGRTVDDSSRWSSQMVAGRTARQGSPFASAIPSGRYSGFPASTSARGIVNFGIRGKRPLWASRLH